jgi:hypothetical protein
MDARFIEQLENRQFLSAVVACPALQDAGSAPAARLDSLLLARVKYPNIVGTWKGSAKSGGDVVKLTFKVKSQKSDRFTARITSKSVAQLTITLKGRFTSKRKVKFTLKGRDSEGSFTGDGSGEFNSNATKLSGRSTLYSDGHRESGTLVLKRVSR